MKKILLFISLFFITATSVYAAATATPSASPTEEQVTNRLKELIDTVSKNRTDQVKGTVDELALRKRGFIGVVERVIEKTVTVKTLKDKKEVLVIEPSVVIIKDGKRATLNDIAVDDSVIALGYTTDEGFALRQLIISTTSLLPKTYDNVVGTAETVSKTQITLTPANGGEDVVYTFAKDTKYEDNQGSTIKIADLKKDTQYVVISVRGKDPKVATFIKSLAADSR